AARLAANGPNELPSARPPGVGRLLADAASEPMVLLLAACGALYLLLGDHGDALMLLGFVGLVVGMTVIQKRRTERSLGALRQLAAPRALVLRDGRPQRIAGRELVEGDLLLLAEGDRVPADLVLAAIDAQPTPTQAQTRSVVRQVAAGGLALASLLGVLYWWLRGD
ncbi:P-type ATPase, partial [Duganella margarita]|uniref:P-type ATPase n=1 Tax=Duganella margarita TaxID=2692170 RepID=UPI0022773062